MAKLSFYVKVITSNEELDIYYFLILTQELNLSIPIHLYIIYFLANML